jgi:hypothetical protein
MPTYNVTGAGGTTGHPSNGRTPYMVENTIDVSAINGDAGAAQNDVIQCLDIPAETLIMEAGIEVVTALSGSVTMDLGITGGDIDRYADGDTNERAGQRIIRLGPADNTMRVIKLEKRLDDQEDKLDTIIELLENGNNLPNTNKQSS